ncbi:hypothetical protein KOI35_19170 [Actinoplanes bogorensis]|uniref:Uncharacterized protein n=1 Tax=Paractinoplanes bogorensis TaxID=1610840 RepID=A0ABS5YQA3_9ACTN|nr:hypothetical protein [Actinoplanes bogorensis]MBU2665635.1 hypothetical protein [Actinoplanes bogorensis]
MPKVKINPADYQSFSDAAEVAGTTVDQWLAEAGRAQAFRAAHGMSRVMVSGQGPLDRVWQEILHDLFREVSSSQDLNYLMRAQLHAVVNDTALLTVHDAFTRDVIESRLREPVATCLARQLGRPVHVAVTLTEPPAASLSGAADSPAPTDQLKRLDQAMRSAETRLRERTARSS